MNILNTLEEIQRDPTRKAGFDSQRGDFLIIYEKELEIIITKLKSLEIIKEKEVNVHIFRHCSDLAAYNAMAEENEKLTQQEFDILKETCL